MNRIAFFLVASLLVSSQAFAETWTPVSTGTTNTINSLFFVSRDTGWIAGENSTIRKTVDGGATWTAQSASGNIKTIRFVNSRVGWAVGESGGAGLVLRTTNGGATWIPQVTSGQIIYDVQMINEESGYIAGAGGFLRYTRDSGATWTTDGGNTWPTINSGTSNDIRRMWTHVSGTLLGFVGSNGLNSRRTLEGNNTIITDSTTTRDLHDFAFISDSGLCVGAQGTILRSVDGAETWSVQASGSTADLYTLTSVSTRLDYATGAMARAGYAAGANGILLRTTDAGKTWVTVNSGTTNAIRAASVNVATGGWIAGDQGTLLKLTTVQPLYLSYGIPTFTAGFAINPVVPKILASGPVRFSVSPELPAGLRLDTATGIISGTPTTETPATNFDITATNHLGSLTVTKRITILKAPTLSYSNPSAQYTVGASITANRASLMRPNGTWDRWDVTPPLPAGLKLDTARNGGDITGTPTAASPAKDYLVTATLSNGTWVSFSLNITVTNPTSLALRSEGQIFGFTAPGSSPLHFKIPGTASEARLEIFSVQARELWASRHSVDKGLVWNGRSANGKELPSGVYGLRIAWKDQAGKTVGTSMRRFTLLRQ